MWKPKDPKAIVLIKLVCWAGVLTWMAFMLVAGLAMARLAAVTLPSFVGNLPAGGIWVWVVPIWIVFTTLLLVLAVARYVNKKLGKKKEE